MSTTNKVTANYPTQDWATGVAGTKNGAVTTIPSTVTLPTGSKTTESK